MDISRIRTLRGPNLWTRHTAIQAIVTLEPDECRVADAADLEQRLRARFPQMAEPLDLDLEGPFTLAHVVQHVALMLQIAAGCPVTFGLTAATRQQGVFQIVVEYTEEEVGHRALALAETLVRASLADQPLDLAPQIDALRELDEEIRLGPSTGSIVQAAIDRDIPIHRLTQGSLVQMGWGRRQRRIQAAEVDNTSSIAESIAQDKDLTKELLSVVGVPVPAGEPVHDVEHAWRVMQELGKKVVVKPIDGNQGKGVTVNVTTREQLERAYEEAEKYGSQVLVERYLHGHDFRLLVVGDKLVAAARRDPPFVTGDGTQTVRQLVDRVNLDPRRGTGHATSLTRIRLDQIALDRLALQGLTPESVPAAGQRVVLRNNANLSTGGSATDVTDEVHPEMAARAIETARTIGLHIAGIDVVCRTVFAPMDEQGGGVVEVNAAPGLRMHLSPSFGKGRPIGQAVIQSMFAPGEDGRIPVVAITGNNGKTTTTRLVAHILTASGCTTGLCLTDGVWVGGHQIDSGDCSGPKSARKVLLHPDADAAVLETARGGILREGLAFDACNVAVVTNIGAGDHLGMNFIDTAEELAAVKRVIIQNVRPDGWGVLNAADPLTAGMAAMCPGQIIFFGNRPDLPALLQHRAQGGRCIWAEADGMVITEGVGAQEARRVLSWQDIPLTLGGRIPFQRDNAMAAVAAAWGLGLDWEVIRSAVASFTSDAAQVPGRFNLIDYRGATVVADYGHNPDAMQALVDAIEAMPGQRRSVVISAAGDRRDEDIEGQTRILGPVFDDVILYQDAAQRGRADGEVLGLLRRGLEGASRARLVAEVHGEFAAIDLALSRLKPGDLCLILIDQVEEALAHLQKAAAG